MRHPNVFMIDIFLMDISPMDIFLNPRGAEGVSHFEAKCPTVTAMVAKAA